mgnify:CR=1 FL=1
MIRRPQTAKLSNDPELTPLIDIVFIVIVFLLLTANVQILSLPVDIPDTDSQLSIAQPEEQSLTVAIRSTPPYWELSINEFGNNQYQDWLEFKDSLIQQLNKPNATLLITPDAEASAESLLQLLALLNENAFSNVRILMEAKK